MLLRANAVGGQLLFDDLSLFDPETRMPLQGINSNHTILLRGTGKFHPNHIILKVLYSKEGIICDTITEILFVREDIVP